MLCDRKIEVAYINENATMDLRSYESGQHKKRKNTRDNGCWLDRMRDDIKEKGMSADDVYDRATWRRMSSTYIDPT